MQDVRQGDTVALSAQFEDGAFPNEYLVTFSTIDGEVSGFVKEGVSVKMISGKPVLVGQVQAVLDSALDLFIRGSFFTNSGYVRIKSDQVQGTFA